MRRNKEEMDFYGKGKEEMEEKLTLEGQRVRRNGLLKSKCKGETEEKLISKVIGCGEMEEKSTSKVI